MWRFFRLESSGEIFGAYQETVFMENKHFDIIVYMIDGSHLHADSVYAEGTILDSLESLD